MHVYAVTLRITFKSGATAVAVVGPDVYFDQEQWQLHWTPAASPYEELLYLEQSEVVVITATRHYTNDDATAPVLEGVAAAQEAPPAASEEAEQPAAGQADHDTAAALAEVERLYGGPSGG